MLLYGTKSRENNRPNGQPAKCITPSELFERWNDTPYAPIWDQIKRE